MVAILSFLNRGTISVEEFLHWRDIEIPIYDYNAQTYAEYSRCCDDIHCPSVCVIPY